MLASTSSNIATFVENCRRLMVGLPAPHAEVLLAGDLDGNQVYQKLIRFEASSHMAYVEEADAYSAAVETFLAR